MAARSFRRAMAVWLSWMRSILVEDRNWVVSVSANTWFTMAVMDSYKISVEVQACSSWLTVYWAVEEICIPL